MVVDDTTALSSFAQKLMQSVATAANLQIRFYTVQDFIQVYHEANSHQRLFLVVQSPHEARLLFEGGVPPVSYTHLDVYKRQLRSKFCQ